MDFTSKEMMDPNYNTFQLKSSSRSYDKKKKDAEYLLSSDDDDDSDNHDDDLMGDYRKANRDTFDLKGQKKARGTFDSLPRTMDDGDND